MPLFMYKCRDCENMIEKFQHDVEDLEVICSECDGYCDRQMPFTHSRTRLDAKTMLKEQIGPDAQRIMNNMSSGKDRDFFDIYGDK